MKNLQRIDTRLAEEAADWLVRLLEDASDDERAAFVVWLKRSPRHMEEFLLVSATRQLFNAIDPQREIDIKALVAKGGAGVLPFPANSSQSAHKRAPMMRRLLSAPALRIAAVAAGVALLGYLVYAINGRDGHTYVTGIGEQRAFRLEDGSLLHLNTRSQATVEFSDSARDVRLIEGEALFTVQRDGSRPFRVLTRTAIVEAIGTQFNVYERADGTRVSVVEGRVKIMEQNSEPEVLGAGEEARVGVMGKVARNVQPNIAAATAWRQRRLAFHGETLAEVVKEFNRYNELQLRIEGAEKLQRRITAVFNADEPQALLRFLEGERNVQMHRQGNVVTIWVRADTPESIDR